MSNEHFYNYTSKNLSISLPFFSSHHSVLILSLKTFCFFYLGKQNIKQYTYFRILTWMSYQASCLVFPKQRKRKWTFSINLNARNVNGITLFGLYIFFQKVINECLVLLFATRNLSFLFLISQLSQFASKAEVIFVNFCLGLWRRRKWEDICKIIFIVGFEL